ncbi:patatin-like phospholipase [Megavirus chiliensis]|uniref:Patatin-like phospholipase n=4 Tax=Megamimivirinae TaxID=3044648 RepID=A0A2L2DM80_MIMIV|nr:putative patatin-like phospholipase [Megavirus chiliensis]AEQ33381.1 patatin-like phospholipase [Megavirus chiliensis]AVG47278.1 patatin-like phospholipase [Acanthamoeba polyphaga mimivirus]
MNHKITLENESDNNESDDNISNLICDTNNILKEFKKKYNIAPEPKYYNIVLSGGSVRGLSHIGAVKKLVDDKLINLNKIKAVAGASAGALFGLLIVLGFDIDEIWNFVLDLDTKKMVNPDLLLILNKCGIDTGKIIYDLFEEILFSKTNNKHINFRQLYEITKIHFTVVGSCLTTKKAVYYDYINTPNFKVSVAIRISIGMPGFFVPVTIDDKKYIDGAILDNYPMNLFKDRLSETIGILICNEYNTDYKCFEEYFMAIINLFMHQYYLKMADQYTENTIYVTKSPNNVCIFNFDLDNITKKELYEGGYEAAREFIEKIKIEK